MQDEFELIRKKDLVDNPSARIAVCLCLDVSSSMEGEPINELNEGIRKFYEAIRSDETALRSAEICIVTFPGDTDQASCYADFSSLSIQGEAPTLTAYGNTPMGEGVRLALDLLTKRKQEYNNSGVAYYQPWLVLMTDGYPNGDTNVLEDSIKRTRDLAINKKLSLFPIGIGNDADMNTLARFSPNRPPLRLKGLNFKEFFEWLSKSISRVSQSASEDKVQFDVDGLKPWASTEA